MFKTYNEVKYRKHTTYNQDKIRAELLYFWGSFSVIVFLSFRLRVIYINQTLL